MLGIFRSLQSKLILTFVIVSISGTLLTTLIVYLSNQRAFNDLRHEQRKAAFIEEVLAYYQTNGSWENAAVELRNQLRNTQEDASENDRPQEPPPPFALIGIDNRVIIPNPQIPLNEIVSAEMLNEGIPLEVNGAKVGTLLIDDNVPIASASEAAIVAQANRALAVGAVGATALAIVLAILLSRTLTMPLKELATASYGLAHGDLNQSVHVRTQDELGELAAAFNQMSSKLGQLNQTRRQLTADIAHDLGTPLTVLSGYLEAMEDGTLSASPDRLKMMRQEIQVLQRLVEDLSTLSLADTGQLTLHKGAVQLNSLLTQVQSAYAHQAGQKGVELRIKSAGSVPTLDLDPARMRQAIGNLVSNALHHTPNRGSITLATQTQTEHILISITDTGSGIPAEDLPHIFNRFYRGDRSRQERTGGSGLGLAIAKSLIEAHKGTINVTSTVSAGTAFTISLPID